MARVILLLIVLLSTANVHAGLWQIEDNAGTVFGSFTHNPGGPNLDPVPYFENIVFSDAEYFASDGLGMFPLDDGNRPVNPSSRPQRIP